jgi:hypothetical protein
LAISASVGMSVLGVVEETTVGVGSASTDRGVTSLTVITGTLVTGATCSTGAGSVAKAAGASATGAICSTDSVIVSVIGSTSDALTVTNDNKRLSGRMICFFMDAPYLEKLKNFPWF